MRKVIIVAGQINTGKTARLLTLFNTRPPGTADGLASVKCFSEADGEFLGYRLKRLTTGEEVPFIVLKDRCRHEFARSSGFFNSTSFVFDRFIFSQTAIRWGEKILTEAIANEAIRDIFLDEIGPIELQGQGFAAALRKVLESEKNLYLGINERNIIRVTESFNIAKYTINAG